MMLFWGVPPLVPQLPLTASKHKFPCFTYGIITAWLDTVSLPEVQGLKELYYKLSNKLHQDNLIHKDEFMWALFKANKDNLFAERVS
jgi:hypothetical protein